MTQHMSMTTEEEARLAAHHKKMTETPLPRLIVQLAIPSILSMMISSIYNMADTYFVAQLGTSAAGAVGVVFSMMALLQAAGYMLGLGSGNILARQLGAKDSDAANRTASTGFFTSFTIGLIFAVVGQLFLENIMWFMGATETILPFAMDYGRYILFAAPFMCASFTMNVQLRNEGKSALGTIGITIGGVLNVILDPIFIFTFGLQTAGAAIATALSQTVGFFVLLSFYLRGKSNLRLSIRRVSKDPKVYGRIFLTGMPSFSRQGLSSVASMLLNRSAGIYGDAAVAAMSIVTKVFSFFFTAMIGFLQGYQPVAGFNFGAKKFDRVRKAAIFSGMVCFTVATVLAVVCYIAAPHIITAFRRDDLDVIEIGTRALRFQCIVLPLCAISSTTNSSNQSTGQPIAATILSMCRQGIFFIPLILILPAKLGLLGLELTQAASDFCSLSVSIPFLIGFFRMLRKKENEEAEKLEKSVDRV